LIYKELDPFSSSDKFLIAGRRAEEQMAHYLRRFFASSADVDVLNYVRVAFNGEVAQLDHLVLHPFGLTIVESKSVAGSVQIKDDGQWIRWFNKQPQGMRSPITQAKMQGMVLRALLAGTVKQKGFFDEMEIDLLVAISDSGTIQWPSSGVLRDVCKADQVPERIIEHLSGLRSAGARAILGTEHRRAMSEFLLRVHVPVEAPAASRAPLQPLPHSEPETITSAPKEEPAVRTEGLPDKVCKHCGSRELEAQHGKYGYYFACKTCQKNTPIKFACPKCGGEGRIRKHGSDFFAECRSCDASTLYHTNQS
jgi:hypothetical protein